MKRTPGPDIMEYADTYHIDTVVIIWKSENTEEAERVRDFIGSYNPAGVHEVDCSLYYTATFGPLSGMAFFAFGEEGCREEDGVTLDNYASLFPCETEMWFGSGDDVHQTRAITLPNWEEVA